MKPSSDLASDPEAVQSLHGLARERLREYGITLKAPKKRVFPVTPMRPPASSKKVFGRPLRDLVPNTVLLDDNEVVVPHFLSAVIKYLQQHKDTEGLFRKAGSAARQKMLRAEVEASETFHVDDEDGIAPLDVASLLKTWLRELLIHQEPLIPFKLHEALLSSTSLGENEKTEAILLCCLLLPPLNAASLAYLARFLRDVSEAKDSNKMDAQNLAIIFTPCLFSVEEEDFHAKNAEKTKSLEAKHDVVQTLISNASRVCMLDEAMETALNLPSYFASHSEDNLEDGNEAHGGPSERRRKKKKRRSGSLSRVLTATMKGIHKAISRSTTPSGARHNVDGSTSARTPFEFSSPSVVPSAKRRAPDHAATSPSKQRKGSFEASLTPKVVRHRSISIKNRFKRKKSLPGAKAKEAVLLGQNSTCTTPLPSKPTLASLNLLSAATPATPMSFEMYLPNIGQDLSQISLDNETKKDAETTVHDEASQDAVDSATIPGDDIQMKEDFGNSSLFEYRVPSSQIATSSSSTSGSCSSSQASLSSNGSGKKRRSGGNGRKPRSPSERKIGIVRRRSQEMARKGNLASQQQQQRQHRPNVATYEFPDDASVRSRLRRGPQQTNTSARAKPSPLKADSTATSGRGRSEAAKCFPEKNLNESLTNLRHDISSLIESSFGGGSNSKTSSIVADDNQFGVKLQKMTISTTPKRDDSSFLRLEDFSVPPISTDADDFTMPSISGLGKSSNSLGVTTRGSLYRRQSSAFEFSRPESELSRCMPTRQSVAGSSSKSFRRQSSAFEIAAAADRKETFERASTRASLKHRNSSVKDLVKRLESSTSSSSMNGAGKSETIPKVTSFVDKRRSMSAASLPYKPQSATVATRPPLEEALPVPLQRSASPVFARGKAAKPDLVTASENKDSFDGGDQFDEQWMDASEFFNSNKIPSVFVLDDTPSGCKRSSIIRIRNEKKGMVSKSVETFTKPAVPHMGGMVTPSRHHVSRPPMITPNSSNPRRISARMGVATSVRGHIPPPPTFAAPTSTATTVSTNSAVVTRRQTLTGIRTTPQHSNRRTPITVKQTSHRDQSPKIVVKEDKNDEPIYANVGSGKHSSSKERMSTPSGVIPKSSRLLSDKRHDRPVVMKRQESDEEKGHRKSKRLEGRRFLTIGYDGEVRSPFRERQNVLPTVQRSKSAQTPKAKNITSAPKRENSDDEIFAMSEAAAANVLRSKSLRTPNSGIKVPASLRETIYDVTTPKSEKVRRNLSDRVVTPRAGRENEAGPFIKTVLTNSRTKGTTPMRTPSRSLTVGASPTVRNSPRTVLNRY